MGDTSVSARSVLDTVELAEVVVQSFNASLKRLAKVEGLQFALGTAWALKDDEEGILCRFVARCSLFFDVEMDDENADDDEFSDGHLLARLQCVIVCEYEVPSGSWTEVQGCAREEIAVFLLRR